METLGGGQHQIPGHPVSPGLDWVADHLFSVEEGPKNTLLPQETN